MKKQIAGALSLAALVAAPLAWAGTAGAGSPSAYSVTPQSGPAGTVVTATGNNCPNTGGNLVYVYWTIDLPPGYLIINEPSAPNDDGTFSVQAMVPADALPGAGDIGVQCSGDEGSQATQHFAFEVTATPESTTTTTTAPPAVAAAGVAATPAFTG